MEKSCAEKGCIEYALHQDIKDEVILTFIEKWKDEAAVETHNASEHFTTIVPKLGALQEKDAELNLYKKIDF